MAVKQNPTDFFNEEMAQAYDERNSKLAPIKDALLFTTNLILRELPEDAKILCVGAGTGWFKATNSLFPSTHGLWLVW